jgi:hypothetical protein
MRSASQVPRCVQSDHFFAAIVIVPSPLAGEGYSVFQQEEWVRGRVRNPSPVRVCWTSGAALSRKGRGHYNVRPAC